MKLDVLKIDGSKAGNITADKTVFGIEPNAAVVRQAVLAEMTNMRQGTHASKNRAKVRGGGKKPFKQKGRGVARFPVFWNPAESRGSGEQGPAPRSRGMLRHRPHRPADRATDSPRRLPSRRRPRVSPPRRERSRPHDGKGPVGATQARLLCLPGGSRL